MLRAACLLWAFGLVAGCTRPLPPLELDAGPRDAGVVPDEDAGPVEDAGAPDDAPALDVGMPDAGVPDAGMPDAGTPDAGVRCTAGSITFGPPTRVAGLSDSMFQDDGATVTPDERIGLVRRGLEDSFYEHLAAAPGAFGAGTAIGINSPMSDANPFLSPDGLTLYFASTRTTPARIWVSTRTTRMGAWSTPTAMSSLFAPGPMADPFVVGGDLYFSTSGFGRGQALWVSDGMSGIPTTITELDSSNDERAPVLSEDGLEIFFSRDGGGMGDDIFVATRTTASGTFGAPVLVTALRASADDQPEALSADGCRLYFLSNRVSNFDVYVASRAP